MLRVALTGGAASGKSAVAAMLRDLGAFVSQSDEVARAMMQPGGAVYLAIAHHFGTGVVRPNGALNRGELARLAFRENRVGELNSLVHPPVIAFQAAWMAKVAVKHPAAVAVVESALVLETTFGQAGDPAPWRSRFDRILLVAAPETVRLERYIRRVMASDPAAVPGDVEADARARFAVQMPEAQKRALADAVIENDGSLEHLRSQVERVYGRLHREAEDSAAGSM